MFLLPSEARNSFMQCIIYNSWTTRRGTRRDNSPTDSKALSRWTNESWSSSQCLPKALRDSVFFFISPHCQYFSGAYSKTRTISCSQIRKYLHVFVAEWGRQTLKWVCYRAWPGSAMCVQSFDDSRDRAIRITYRISLRSSSLWEPRRPLLKVVHIKIWMMALIRSGRVVEEKIQPTSQPPYIPLFSDPWFISVCVPFDVIHLSSSQQAKPHLSSSRGNLATNVEVTHPIQQDRSDESFSYEHWGHIGGRRFASSNDFWCFACFQCIKSLRDLPSLTKRLSHVWW